MRRGRTEIVKNAADGRARNFERRRLEIGLTRLELAAEFGTTDETIRRWEGGVNHIPDYAFLALQYLADREA